MRLRNRSAREGECRIAQLGFPIPLSGFAHAGGKLRASVSAAGGPLEYGMKNPAAFPLQTLLLDALRNLRELI